MFVHHALHMHACLATARAAHPFRRPPATRYRSLLFDAPQLTFGQEMVLVGDAEALGGWQLEAAPVMTWSEGDDWRVAVALPAGAPVEYKFAIKDPNGCAS